MITASPLTDESTLHVSTMINKRSAVKIHVSFPNAERRAQRHRVTGLPCHAVTGPFCLQEHTINS